MTELSKAQSTPFHRAHHRFAALASGCVFLLIVAGALVTSNEAGLSVPDWPTSFGSLYRIPPLIGGVKFEHGHRMLAEFIGILTIGIAVWTQKVDRRGWMRILGWSALGTVIAQGVLGGLTVLFYLPPAISTAHATLGQTFFCIMVSIAFFTSRSWVEAPGAVIRPEARPRLTTLSLLTVAAVWLQLILGAAFRHSGIRLLPHLIGAGVVLCMVSWLAITTLNRHRGTPQLATPARCRSRSDWPATSPAFFGVRRSQRRWPAWLWRPWHTSPAEHWYWSLP
jgi:cytochrome c oxidase assembly protein subunit 15